MVPVAINRLIFFALAVAMGAVLMNAIPGVTLPVLSHFMWSGGFSLDFFAGDVPRLHATSFGGGTPQPAAFGVPGMFLVGLLAQITGDVAFAYSAVVVLFVALVVLFIFTVLIRLGFRPIECALLAIAWLSIPLVWWHVRYGYTAIGFLLLPTYLLPSLLFHWSTRSRSTLIAFTAIAAGIGTFALFMDGYSFMMAAVFNIVYLLIVTFPYRSWANFISFCGLIGAYCLSYLLYIIYIGDQGAFSGFGLTFFRSYAIDLTMLVYPTEGVHWLMDALGLSASGRGDVYYGDWSVWSSSFLLPLLVVVAFCLALPRFRPPAKMTAALLFIVVLGVYLALGPALKVGFYRDIGEARMLASGEGLPPTGSWFLWESISGFSSTRAVYRWLALAAVGAWVLLVLTGYHSRRRWLFSVLAPALLIVLYIPNLAQQVADGRRHMAAYEALDRTVVVEFAELIGPTETTVHLPIGNDWLINYAAAATDRTFVNIGGDKNLALASASWPAALQALLMVTDADRLAPAAGEILARGEADVVVVSDLSLLGAAHRWPPAEGQSAERQAIREAILAPYRDDPAYVIVEADHLSTLRLVASD